MKTMMTACLLLLSACRSERTSTSDAAIAPDAPTITMAQAHDACSQTCDAVKTACATTSDCATLCSDQQALDLAASGCYEEYVAVYDCAQPMGTCAAFMRSGDCATQVNAFQTCRMTYCQTHSTSPLCSS